MGKETTKSLFNKASGLKECTSDDWAYGFAEGYKLCLKEIKDNETTT